MEPQRQTEAKYIKEEWELCIDCGQLAHWHKTEYEFPCEKFKGSGTYLLTEEEWNGTD